MVEGTGWAISRFADKEDDWLPGQPVSLIKSWQDLELRVRAEDDLMVEWIDRTRARAKVLDAYDPGWLTAAANELELELGLKLWSRFWRPGLTDLGSRWASVTLSGGREGWGVDQVGQGERYLQNTATLDFVLHLPLLCPCVKIHERTDWAER